MQSFFYRAILCDFNTLFVIEILESFSNFQYIKMYSYIDKILTYKLENYDKEKKHINKSSTREYLNSCIIFVYKNLENEAVLENELMKYGVQKQDMEEYFYKDNKKENMMGDLSISNLSNNLNNDKLIIQDKALFENIKVFSSEICDLGKSFKIKKLIKEKNEIYYHFPLGGMMTKKVIYEKLFQLLKKIKKDLKNRKEEELQKIKKEEEDLGYNNVSIHLDIMESEETSLINEFLFSFLVAKFYTNNGNIIYIPNNIKIYVEIPNSFENYLKKFGILNVFEIKNIALGELPELELEEYIKQIFNRIIGKSTNKEIEEFIKENIGIKEYSYHQVKTFIKIFINQFNTFGGKLKFSNSQGIDITNKIIKDTAESTKYFTNGGFPKLIMDKKQYIKDKIDLCLEPYENDLNKVKFKVPLIFVDKKTMKLNIEIFSDNFNESVIETSNKMINSSYKYLKRLKQILYLENDLEKDEGNRKSLLSILDSDNLNYVITEDTYKKMLLLIYIIKADVPIIIMGETGCGKTSLIIKLSQILNNGEKLVEIINIHPGITYEEICKKMKKINENAKRQEYISKGENIKKELWVFFDEINTCLSFSLLTEIFINRTFNGEKLEENIRLIGACNPYRRRKELSEICGLTREDDKEDELVYKVEQLPQSLLYYVFNFGSLNDEEEKKYIKSIIQKLFTKDEEELYKLTTEAISKCHKFLRNTFGDPSIISLREIDRFTKCVEFFQEYLLKKYNQNKYEIDDDEKKLYKIKSIICSIYLCYYIRLINYEKRGRFDNALQYILLRIVNVYSNEKDDEEIGYNLFEKIKYKKFKYDFRDKNIEQFSDLLKIEEDFLIEQIELDKGIGKNEILKENLFVLFLSIVTKIPLIIVGKSGTGKSLSTQLIYNSMKGKYSKNLFFKKYPPINKIYFQGSESTSPENVIELFNKAEGLYQSYKNIKKKDDVVPTYIILFDNLDLAERAPDNPLEILKYKLEYDGKKEGICFIGISNYSLDAAKLNRALYLSVQNLEEKLNQLKITSKSILRSISEDISKDSSKLLIFNILSKAYQLYKFYLNFIKKLIVLKKYIKNKEELRRKDLREIELQQGYKKLLKKEEKIKLEFHGYRDFYNLIKGVAIEGSKLNNISDENQIIPIIENYIERNFGGISYEIDINFELEPEDIKEEMKILKDMILKEKIYKSRQRRYENNKEQEEDKIIKVTSVYLFKKIYNEACSLEYCREYNIKGSIYKIKNDNMDKYDLNKCINDNIKDNNSRYLLLEIKSNLVPLINQIISKQNTDKKEIYFISMSPFIDDNNNNKYKIKNVYEIQNSASKPNKIVLLQNLDLIQPYLYDFYNMNYEIIDGQKYARICLDNFKEELILVNDSFRIIILVDKIFANSANMAFLNRLEKMEINFSDLLNPIQKKLQKNIINEIRLKEEIMKEQSKFNYDLNQLLINCGEEEIGGMIYYYFLINKKENIDEYYIEGKIYSKISNILPQDIIINLSERNPIKNKYYCEKRYNNFKEYINDINNYKISIIYTFSSITSIIEGCNKIEHILISEIRTEDELISNIDSIISKNKNEYQNNHLIIINFEQYNSNKIQFTSDFIKYCYQYDDYNYIFIIHIQRSFLSFENKSKNEIIYSISNIYENRNQLFIDNLNGPDISLKNLLYKDIKDIIFYEKKFLNLDNEFQDSLKNFIYKEIPKVITNFSIFHNKKYDEKKYMDEIINYMEKDI